MSESNRGEDAVVRPDEINVRPVAYQEIVPFRDARRSEAGCQMVRDSILPRGLAEPFLISVGNRPVGYGAVWNAHFPGRAMEFFVSSEWWADASALFREFLVSSRATHVEAQTNMPMMSALAAEFAADLAVENLLFEDGPDTFLTCADAEFRARREGDVGLDGEWVVERGGDVIAAGGVLHHYNPPFADLYIAVEPSARREGVGSYLVQELRRACRESGGTPAARCDPGNAASRRTLVRGGMLECGQLVAGPL